MQGFICFSALAAAYGLKQLFVQGSYYLFDSRRIGELIYQPIFSKENITELLKSVGKRHQLVAINCVKSQTQQIFSRIGAFQAFTDNPGVQRNFEKFKDLLKRQSKGWVSKQVPKKFLLFGKIATANVLSAKHEFFQASNKGSQKLLKVIKAILSFLPNIFTKILRYFFKGPAIGYLISTFGLTTDQELIMECMLEKGRITPKLMGLSRQDLIQYYNKLKRKAGLKIVGIILSLILLLIFAVKFFKWNRRWLDNDYFDSGQRNQVRNILRSSLNHHSYVREPSRPLYAPSVASNVEIVDNQLRCLVCRRKCKVPFLKNCEHTCLCRRCKDTDEDTIGSCNICSKKLFDVNNERIK